MIKKIFSTSVIYALGPQIPKIAGLFILPIITPYLSRNDFGVWGTIIAYSSIFSIMRDLGMSVPLINSFFKNPTRWKWVWGQIYFFLIVYGVLYTAVQLGVIYFIFPKEVPLENKLIILLLLGLQSLFFDIPIMIGTRLFQILERPIPVSTIAFFSGFLAVFVQCISVIYFHSGYLSWFYATFFSTFLSAICFTVLIHKNHLYPLPTLRMQWLKPRIKVSLPLLPHNYSAYLLNASDRVVMNFYKVSTQNIGQYNVAYMWGNYMDLVGGAVGNAVGPLYYKYFSNKGVNIKKELKHFNDFLQISFISLTFIISIWTKELFQVFIRNKELNNAYSLAVIIIMGYCYRPMYWLVVNRLQYAEKTNQLWKISFVGGILNLILNFIFIPIFGYEVAAITTFISLLYIGFSGFFLKEFKKLDQTHYYPMTWMLLIIIFTAIAFYAQNASYMLKLLICLGSLLPVYFYGKKITKYD